MWHDTYALGVEDIDLQHHYFLNLINRLGTEIAKPENQEYVEALISELNAYARFHFTSEETMMLHSDYPQYEAYRRHHIELIELLSIKEYNLLHPKSTEEAEAIIDFLTEWFVHHTMEEDRAFTTFLQQRGS